jgi:hypothetical protein
MAIQLLDKKLVMKPKRSSMVKVEKQLDIVENYDSDSENIYQEPRADKFDEIIGLLKQGNVYGEKDNITLGAVDVPIEKQIAIDKVSTKGLKSETYKNDSKSKLDKLRKLRRGN